mmetsp:Transcript_950/g.2807  ORF Transcript_950/g.2807 Transcript_950/m.2807 type:complete len:202 (-) Transcript_950:175-780(-)
MDRVNVPKILKLAEDRRIGRRRVDPRHGKNPRLDRVVLLRVLRVLLLHVVSHCRRRRSRHGSPLAHHDRPHLGIHQLERLVRRLKALRRRIQRNPCLRRHVGRPHAVIDICRRRPTNPRLAALIHHLLPLQQRLVHRATVIMLTAHRTLIARTLKKIARPSIRTPHVDQVGRGTGVVRVVGVCHPFLWYGILASLHVYLTG